jgi:hypothetical protein
MRRTRRVDAGTGRKPLPRRSAKPPSGSPKPGPEWFCHFRSRLVATRSRGAVGFRARARPLTLAPCSDVIIGRVPARSTTASARAIPMRSIHFGTTVAPLIWAKLLSLIELEQLIRTRIALGDLVLSDAAPAPTRAQRPLGCPSSGQGRPVKCCRPRPRSSSCALIARHIPRLWVQTPVEDRRGTSPAVGFGRPSSKAGAAGGGPIERSPGGASPGGRAK